MKFDCHCGWEGDRKGAAIHSAETGHDPMTACAVLLSESAIRPATDSEQALIIEVANLEETLRNVRAGVWTALNYDMSGMARIQLRAVLPEGYLPVGMGGDPGVAASTAPGADDE